VIVANDPDNIRYLSVANVVALHRGIMIRLRRVPEALRDERLLESAIMRPRMAAHYEGADLLRQAALYAISISQAQTFVDGNKRAGYASADTFLRLNGYMYVGRPIELAQQLEAVASRDDDLESATSRFEEWLGERVAPRG
jgi:death on curing protein